MSADAWESCPICNGLPEKLRGGYKHLYGKVSEQDYEKAKKEYETVGDSTSVRVDFEYTLKADKTIFLTFYAECKVCGEKWEHQGVVK